jgi:hypothetical protein
MRWLFFLCFLQGFAAFNLTWGIPAASLDANPPIGDTDSNAVIAMDPLGNAVGAWSRTTGGGASENIWAATYNHAQRVWIGAVQISGGGSASHPTVAVDDEGNAIFVWEEGFPTRIQYRMLSNEGVWTPDLSQKPFVVHPSKNGQILPQIAIDGKGDAVLIWAEFFNAVHHIFSAKKTIDGPWICLGEISLNLEEASIIPSKALALNKRGDAVAVWQEPNRVHAAKYEDGRWGVPLVVAQSGATSPSVGIDGVGNAIFVWKEANAIFSKKLENGILDELPLAISSPDYVADRPSVGVEEGGNAVVVYERYNLMHKFITSSILKKGAFSWSTPIDISTPSPSDAVTAGYPVFAMNAIGDGVAIWKEWNGSNIVIQGAGFSLGTWSSIRTLSSPTAHAGGFSPAYDISVSLNVVGNLLAIWPEDPLRIGASQIKATFGAGLANSGPLPPVPDKLTIMEGIVTGKQMVQRFPAHTDLINVLTWDSPGGIDHFNVYRGSLSSLIGTTTKQRFEDHQREPKKKELYLITSVDLNGQESGPITIVVHPR